jgi:tetratricopeptide (TPR) repeat protein
VPAKKAAVGAAASARRPAAKAALPVRTASKPVVERPKPFAAAIRAYETGIRLMYAEDFQKAIKCFNDLIAAYPDEAEIQASARARIQACAMRLEQRGRKVLRSADDHYNVGVALMNRSELDSAAGHFQSALKLAPKSDHVLYALAAVYALQGKSPEAVGFLKQSIHRRSENRYQAAADADFARIGDDPAFQELLKTSGN